MLPLKGGMTDLHPHHTSPLKRGYEAIKELIQTKKIKNKHEENTHLFFF
jgi:hypothetical protein